VTVAYGGFNRVAFHPNGEISVHPVTIAPERTRDLDDHLLLFFTGVKRTSSQVARSYADNLDAHRRDLRIAKDLVGEAISVLEGGQDLTAFGELLHEAWVAKRSLSDKVSSAELDGIYQTALDAGAVGGKITGAGGGGYMLLYCRFDQKHDLAERLRSLGCAIHDFAFERYGLQSWRAPDGDG
jgi:D-glycero-alpha-D-manno-heptose-7-phosphate kinase